MADVHRRGTVSGGLRAAAAFHVEQATRPVACPSSSMAREFGPTPCQRSTRNWCCTSHGYTAHVRVPRGTSGVPLA